MKRVTRSLFKDLKKDIIGTYWMSIKKNECLDYEIAVFAIEVPKKEHGTKEDLETKQREIENLQKF